MKKRLSIILTACLILIAFSACVKNAAYDPSKNNEYTSRTATEAPETTEAQSTTTTEKETKKETTTEKETTTKESAQEIKGVYIAEGQADYGISEENLNQITFKNGKAYVQMNFLDAVAEFKVSYKLDEKKGVITLGAGKAQNGTVVFNSGAVLTPDEYWQTLTISGMEKAFVLEGYACPQFFEDGTAFNRSDQ